MRVLWTDGSASPNPGPGGYAVIENGQPVIMGGEEMTTNIRMEGTALIEAILYANGEECEIHSDSEFWINTLTKWAPEWEKNNWRKKTGAIKNLEMVKKAYGLYRHGQVRLVWVRGHVGKAENELADYWANKARKGVRITDLPLEVTQN